MIATPQQDSMMAIGSVLTVKRGDGVRLIDADALNEEIQNVYEEEKSEDPKWAIGLRHSKRIVRDMPTVDAVQVVRCKDCKFHEECMEKAMLEPEWFCADGVRRK